MLDSEQLFAVKILNVCFSLVYLEAFIFRGKTPHQDLHETVRQFGYVGNMTFSSDWFQKNMQSDPVKLFSTTSYIVMIALMLPIVIYSKLEKIPKWKNKFRNCCCVFFYSKNNGNETAANDPIFESKNLIFGTGQTLVIILISIAFFVPIAIVRRIAREDLKEINTKNGKLWIYIGRVTVPTCYQLVFPLFLMINNSKMRRSLWRDLKESTIWMKISNLFSKLKSLKC